MGVLSGSSRKVLAFMRQRASQLIVLAAIPFVAMTVLSIGGMWLMRRFLQDFSAMMEDPAAQHDPEKVLQAMSGMFRTQGLMLLGQLVLAVLFALLAVKVIRLYLADGYGIAASSSMGKATFLFLIYAIGIFILTMLIMIAAAVPLVITVAGIGALMANLGEPNVALQAIAGLMVLPVMLCAMLFASWFGCRFAVGLPAVALGQSPDFFRDLWPLSRGASFGLPLRLIGAYLVLFVALLPVIGYQGYQMFEKLLTMGPEPGPAQIIALQSEMLSGLTWLVPIMNAIGLSFMIFAILLLSESYRRFSSRGAT